MTYTVPETWPPYAPQWENYQTCPHEDASIIRSMNGDVAQVCHDCGVVFVERPVREVHRHHWQKAAINGRRFNLCTQCGAVIGA